MYVVWYVVVCVCVYVRVCDITHDHVSIGVRHVKGMLLYGPPGTGKTLLARQIGKMLDARELKIVNGPG